MKTCPTCHQNYPDDDEYCMRDGSRLANEVRDERECPYCAELILKKARLCKHCRRDVEPVAKPDAPAQAPSPARPQTIVEPPTAQPQASKPSAARAPQFKIAIEGPSRVKYVVLGLVLMAIIAGGIWYFSQSGPEPPPNVTSPSSGATVPTGQEAKVEAPLAELGPAPGEARVNPKDGLKYVWIPPGTFMMGCSAGDDKCLPQEYPVHQVTITKGYWLGQTEVTVGAYKRFAAATGRRMPPEPNLGGRPLNPGWGDEAMPIVDVTWDDAQAYCSWGGARLPMEAEWEYAVRAGSTAAQYSDLDEIAWYADNSGRQRLDSTRIWIEDQANYLKRLNENGNGMHDVGQKRANDFGLYDMLGNVWECVSDWYDPNYYQNSQSQDPSGPASGQARVLRGGSWVSNPRGVRVSDRNGGTPGDGSDFSGFRCGGEVPGP